MHMPLSASFEHVPTARARLSAAEKLCAWMMPFLALGPTIVPSVGLRCEHVSLGLFFLLAVLFFKSGIRWNILASACAAAAISFGFSFLINGGDSIGFVKEFYNASKFLLPFLALCGIFHRRSLEWCDTFCKTAWTSLMFALFANIILQFLNMNGQGIEFASFFVRGADERGSLWQLCLSGRRYCGVLPQPANVGVLASLLAVGACFFWKKGPLLYCALGLAFIASFLASTKAGFVGVFFALAYLFRARPAVAFFSVLFVLGVYLAWEEFAESEAKVSLGIFSEGKEWTLESLTAGRLGDESTNAGAISWIWENYPLFGPGPGINVDFPSDSSWVYNYKNGGIFGVLAYGVISVSAWFWQTPQTRIQIAVLLALVLVMGLGIVVFSGNGNVFVLAVLFAYFFRRKALIPAPAVRTPHLPRHFQQEHLRSPR